MSADPMQQLRAVPLFQDLSEEQLAWFAAQCRVVELAVGDILVRDGDPADEMFVILEGEIRIQREGGALESSAFVARTGAVTGMLPYSRLTHFSVTARAAVHTRIACFPAKLFPELLRRIPEL